jgi:hypothetical protein
MDGYYTNRFRSTTTTKTEIDNKDSTSFKDSLNLSKQSQSSTNFYQINPMSHYNNLNSRYDTWKEWVKNKDKSNYNFVKADNTNMYFHNGDTVKLGDLI